MESSIKIIKVQIGKIKIEQEILIREDLGNLEDLKQRITEGGDLPFPAVNEADGTLVTGRRTVEAYRELYGDDHEIHVRLVAKKTGLELIREQSAANCNRKEFNSAEIDKGRQMLINELEAIKKAVEEKKDAPAVEICHLLGPGKTRDKIAAIFGISGRSLDKITHVYDMVRQDPEHYKPIADQLEQTGNINGAYLKAKNQQKRLEIQAYAAGAPVGDELAVYHGDFRDHADKIPDDGVDLFLVDPPYDRDSIETYGQIAELAARKLRPGGLLLAYSGVAFLPEIIEGMKAHLQFCWMLSLQHTGMPGIFHPYKIRCGWKPITLWVKPPVVSFWDPFIDAVVGEKEKGLHRWQQGLSEAEALIRQFTLPNGLVVDCVCGSGTTLTAAKKLGRRWIGIDRDPEAVQISRRRLAETELVEENHEAA